MMKHITCLMMIMLLAAGAAMAAENYTIVLTNGSRMTAIGPPEFKDGRALFRVPGGSLTFLPEERIDKEATKEANAVAAPKFKELRSTAATPPPRKSSLGNAAPGGHSKSTFSNKDLPELTPEERMARERAAIEARNSNYDDRSWERDHDADMRRRDYKERVDEIWEDYDRKIEKIDRESEVRRAQDEVDRLKDGSPWGWDDHEAEERLRDAEDALEEMEDE